MLHTTAFRTIRPLIFFCQDQDELASPAHRMVLKTSARNQDSELSSATPQMYGIITVPTPYAHCSLDKGVACAQHMQLRIHHVEQLHMLTT